MSTGKLPVPYSQSSGMHSSPVKTYRQWLYIWISLFSVAVMTVISEYGLVDSPRKQPDTVVEEIQERLFRGNCQ